MAALTRSGARKASEIVMLTLRTLQPSRLETYYRNGRIGDIADYCESDVLNTYRVWLRYELFRGRLSEDAFNASESYLQEFLTAQSNSKPYCPCR
jgi:predicted PolB exonuclease-like 3'-5' exonuclease